MTLPADKSHVEQLWAGRLAEQDLANSTRLSNWHARIHRDPVPVPEKPHVVFVPSENVETIQKIRSVG